MRRFVFKGGKSTKFWEIEIDGSTVTTRWGRVGGAGKSETTEHESLESARSAHEKAIRKKTSKGYVEATSAAAAPPSAPIADAQNRDMEDGLHDNPDDQTAWLVYADWLQGQGDPRGELITMQVELKKNPGHKKMKRAVAELLERHKAHFFGTFGDTPDTVLDLEWHYGFLKKAKIRNEFEDKTAPEETLRNFLDHPSARFLQELVLGTFDQEASSPYSGAAQIIGERDMRSLRTLFIGDFEYEENELNWCHAGDISALYKAVPNLESLTVRAGTMVLGDIVLPNLRRFETITGGLSPAAVASIRNAKWPKLNSLVLQVGSPYEGAATDVADFADILAGRNLPELTVLGITNTGFTDDLCREIGTAKILPQLQVLDLSMGTMTDNGAELLLGYRDELAHLKMLDVSEQASVTEEVAAEFGQVFGALVEKVFPPGPAGRSYPIYE